MPKSAHHFPLMKRLVGDWLNITIDLPNAEFLKLELYTNLNHEKQNLSLTEYKPGNSQVNFSTQLTKSGTFWWRLRGLSPHHRWEWLKAENGDLLSGKIQVDPRWLAQGIVYNAFIRFFKGKPTSSTSIKPGDGGTFDDLKYHLDILKAMGINVLYLNPIHLIGEINRKYNMLDQLPSYLQPGSPYSIKDYKSIDPELTYDKDTKKHLLSDPQQEFRDLVNAAHDRGMFVIMDLVFNHTAHDFIFQRIRPEWYFYKEDPTSLEAPFLYESDVAKGKPWGDPHHTLSPYDHGIWWEDAAQLNWEYMNPEGPNPAPPNPSLNEMWEYFMSIPQYWIKHFGIDGFRCDIAYRVPPQFWQACIAEARLMAQAEKNNLSHDVAFIAESYTNDLVALQESGFAAVYGDFSHKLSKPNILSGYLDYIYNLSGHEFPDGSRWFIFPESHDFGRTPQKIIQNPAQDSKAALLANQSRWLLTATLPGIPLIFNGFEKIEWQPLNLFSYGAVDWERDSDLKDFIALVNHLRHHHPSLQFGSYEPLITNQGLNDETQLFAFIRHHAAANHSPQASETMLVIVNMDVYSKAGPAIVYLPQNFANAYVLTDLLSETVYKREGQELIVALEPGQGHLFLVSQS